MLDRYDQDLLLDYLEGELDADRRAEFDAILAQDPQLAGLLSEMAMDRAALRSLPQAQAPSDMVHDVTRTLERRMLLDEPVDEIGPIPLARARGLTSEPRSISWGRVVGLTGLAASVALAAAIVVVTLDDPLERTANEFASSTVEDKSEFAEAQAIDEGAFTATINTPKTGAEGVAESLVTAETKPADNRSPLAARAEALKPGGLPDDALALAKPTTNVRESAPTDDPAASALQLPRDTNQPVITRLLGSTAAISAIQPRQQLVLYTESPEISREQLFEFCVANGIPIVQAEQPLAQQEKLAFGTAQADQDAKDLAAEENYALLLNESQLDTLMLSLNSEATIEPSRAGKASIFSNHAALLTDLTDSPWQGQSNVSSAKQLAEQADHDASRAVDAASDEQSIQQAQAVELRLPPDLGSPYANSRNAYNLNAKKQRASYPHLNQADALADQGVAAQAKDHEAKAAFAETDKLDALEQDKLAERTAKLEQSVSPEPSSKPDVQAVPDEAAPRAPRSIEPDLASNVAPQESTTDKTRPLQIDPTRGNWLAAHLPVADTTPLLLHWRTDPSANPTKLVPVMIKRAELKEVNTLRVRQQVELAERYAKPKAKEQPADEQVDEQALPKPEPSE